MLQLDGWMIKCDDGDVNNFDLDFDVYFGFDFDKFDFDFDITCKFIFKSNVVVVVIIGSLVISPIPKLKFTVGTSDSLYSI